MTKVDRTVIVYSTQKTGLKPGVRYANPRYFMGPRDGVTQVYVVGDWPVIAEAYKKAGVPVVELSRDQAADIPVVEDEPVSEPEKPAAPAAAATPAPVPPAPATEPPPATAPETAKPVTEPQSDAEAKPEDQGNPNTSESQEAQDAVHIPDNWRALNWQQLRSLGSQLTNVPIINRADAIKAVEAALNRRASLAADQDSAKE